MSITHATVAAGTDAGTGEIHKAEWNAEHVISGFNAAFIGAKAYHNTTQGSLAAATINALNLNSEEWDTDGFHDTGSNTSRMTIPAGMGGKYLVIGKAKVDQTGQLYIRKNGSGGTILRGGDTQSGTEPHEVVVIADLVAGDYVEVCEFHNSGTGTAGDASNDHLRTELSLVKLDSGKVGGGIGAKAYNSTTQSLTASSADQTLTFDSEEFDTDGFHSTSSDTGRMTIPAGLGGKYLVAAGGLHSGGTASSLFYFRVNGSTSVKSGLNIGPSSNPTLRIEQTNIIDLAAGDYVEFLCTTNAGAGQTFGHASTINAQAWLSIMRLDSGSSDPTFSDWTPVLTAVTTNPTLGTGSEAYGRYTQHGKLVVARGHIKFGTSGTNAGSGAYRISLPVPAASPAGSVGVYGHGYLYDDSAGTLKQHTLGFVTTTTMQFVIDGTAGSTSPVDNTVPWAWGASDYLLFSMEYEAA